MNLLVTLVAVGLLFMGITIAIINSAPYIALAVVILLIAYVAEKINKDNDKPS